MDPLGQLYLLCTVLGWGFIIATFALGQFGHGHGIHADGAAHAAGHGGGHAGHAGHAGHIDGAGHAGHGHMDGHGGHGSHAGHEGGPDEAHTAVNHVVKSRDNQLYFTLLGIFSPLTVSVFIGFFGSVGFITWHLAHWLGYITLIPAIISGIVATNLIKHLTSVIVSKLAASSLTKMHEGVGRIAQVNTPIQNGRIGEVSYVIGHTRVNASAKPAHDGEEFARGAKVMIVETDGPVVFVEAARDIDLELM
jgi:membrane protein implicated in regulation of membrane protease activity